MLSVPFAIYAATADDDGNWTVSDDDMCSSVNGNPGIGTTNPEASAILDMEIITILHPQKRNNF